MRRPFLARVLIPLALLAAPAVAQTGAAARTGGLEGLGAGSGLLGGMLPNVGGAGIGNVAGLLSYCVKNNVLGGSAAKSALGGLLGRPGVTASDTFTAGQSGQIATPQGGAFSLDDMKGKLKTRMCAMVLQRARSFL